MPALSERSESKCAEGGSRTHDLCVMSAVLLPTELPRLILKFVALPRIARGPAAYETAEVLLLHGPMYIKLFYHKKTTSATELISE